MRELASICPLSAIADMARFIRSLRRREQVTSVRVGSGPIKPLPELRELAFSAVPAIRPQESALLTRSDGDGHDYRHACRRLHTQRQGRPGLFQGRAWLFLRRCRRWMAHLCRAAL